MADEQIQSTILRPSDTSIKSMGYVDVCAVFYRLGLSQMNFKRINTILLGVFLGKLQIYS